MNKSLTKLKLLKIKRTNEQFVYFVGLLYALSTGKTNPVELIKNAQSYNSELYSNTLKEIYRLGVGWGYGLSKSCEIMATKITDNKEMEFKHLLMKFAQVVRLGQDLIPFVKSEFIATLHTYSSNYERNLDSQKLFLEMFYTLMSSGTIMVAANSLLSMVADAQDAERMLILSVFGITLGMGSFSFVLYMLFPRDKLMIGSNDLSKKFTFSLYLSIMLSVLIGTILFYFNALPIPLILAVSAGFLFIPGFIARKLEEEIVATNEWYPPFIRHLGQLISAVGSISKALDSALKSDFGILTKHVNALRNRIQNRVRTEVAFDLFSQEACSDTITNSNSILSLAMAKGGDISEITSALSDIVSKINDLRKKRLHIAKTFEIVIILLHVITMAIFGLMNKILDVFHTVIGSLNVSTSVMNIHPIDPAFFASIMPIIIVSTSVIGAFGIKSAEGGLYKTIWFNIALLTVAGSIGYYLTTVFLGQYLGSSVLNL